MLSTTLEKVKFRPDKLSFKDIEDLAVNSPIVKAALRIRDQAGLTNEQALILMVLWSDEQNRTLKEIVKRRILERPSIIVVPKEES